MVSVTISFLVESMDEVTEAVLPIAQRLQTLTIPPAGHQYVKNMANERGSTVHLAVELVDENSAALLAFHKRKKKELARH